MNTAEKVLVVDDDVIIAKIIRRYLEDVLFDDGLEIVEAHDGLEAIKILQELPDIKLVVSDYNMPCMNGIEVLKWTRKSLEKDVPVLIITGEPASEVSEEIYSNGGRYLQKPFEMDVLEEEIRRFL